MKRIGYILASVLLVVAIAVMPQSPAAAAACTVTQTGSLTEVEVLSSTVKVSGVADNSCTSSVSIHALLASASPGSYSGSTVVGSATPGAGGAFSVTFPRTSGSTDRLYSQYVAVATDGTTATRIGDPRFADKISFTPTNSASRFTPPTQKGLAASMTGDSEELGIGHAAVSVFANNFMTAGPGAAGSTIAFTSAGQTYYFDKKQVTWLDRTVKAYSDNKVLVYLVLVITSDPGNPNSSFPLLVHPDAPTTPLPFFATYAFNTVTPSGIGAFTALMEFISERYSRDDQQYGRALDYIIGNEINSAKVWAQMGPKTLPDFLANYMPALRLAWQAAQKSSAQTRVYTSLDHNWNEPYTTAEPLLFYKAKDVLDGLSSLVKKTGDFPWNLAYHPYPADTLNPRVWNDPVSDSPTSSKITFKNIGQLPAYMGQTSMKYNGNRRHIVLSEQGCSSPSNSAGDQTLQAACFAYSYYKVLAAGNIDAYIWDPQVDNREAGGLRVGLWTWDDDRPDVISPPGEKKLIYNIFKNIDTSDSLTLTDFAKPVIGITNWTDVIPNFVPSVIDSRVASTQVGATAGGSAASGGTIIGAFETAVDGWRPSDHVETVQSVATTGNPQGSKALEVSFADTTIVKSNGLNNRSWRGPDTILSAPVDATSTPILTAAVKVSASGTFDPDNRYSAQVRAYTADGSSAWGTASIDPTGWNRVSIDLSSWSGKSAITRVKIWAKGSSGQTWAGSMLIDDVRFASSVTGSAPGNLDIVAKAEGRVNGSPVHISVTNNGPSALTGSLTATNCAGVALSSTSLSVAGTAAAGGTKTFDTTFAAFSPTSQNFPRFCVDYLGLTIPVNVEVPPVLLYDFEAGTQGWVAQSNISSISSVASFPNGPQTPHGGSRALDVVMTDVGAGQPRTISARPKTPIVLTGASQIYAWVNAYGGAPGATGYEAKMVVFSGTHSISVTKTDFTPDSWNKLAIDLSSWAYRSNVTGIDISYRALGTSATWAGGPHLQLDDVGIVGDYNSQASWRSSWSASLGGQYPAGSVSRADATYRQAMKVASGGDLVRVRLSNPSAATVTFTALSVGVRSGSTAATVAAPLPLTFDGASSIAVPAGASVFSDPVALAVSAGQDVLVSSFASAQLPLLSHDFGLKTNYATPANQGNLTGQQSASNFAAIGTSYYWIDAIDVYTREVTGTIVALGDSITDGAGATADADNRWTNRLSARLQALPDGSANKKVVVNAGIGGGTLSALATAQVGPNGLNRLTRDVLSQSGITDAIVAMGTNDIFVGSKSPLVVHALTLAAQRIRAEGLRPIVATLIPRGNGTGWTSAMEQERQAVNAWIRSQTVFDAVIDFETAVADPANPMVIRASYDADGTHPNAAGYQAMADAVDLAIFAAPSTTPTVTLKTLYDFENGAQGWQAGNGVTSVGQVSSFPNGPTIPAVGLGALSADLATASASTPKWVQVQPPTAIDATGASEVYAWVDGYAAPGASGYAVDITVYSGTESITGTNTQFAPDRWNRVAVDVKGWDKRNAITKIAISYRPLGTASSWSGAKLQVDEVGFSTESGAAQDKVSLFTFESSTTGWVPGANVSAVSRVSSFPNGPTTPHGGSWALQATMNSAAADQARTITVSPSTPINASDGKALRLWFDGYGGMSGVTHYTVDVTVWSGAASVTGTISNYTSDQWSLASVPIAGWSGRSSIDRIDVTYRARGTSATWSGTLLFQIDDVHYLK